MKKILAHLLVVAGVMVMSFFGYIAIGLMSSHPILRWSIFVMPTVYSIGFMAMGLIAAAIGVLNIQRMKDTRHKKPDMMNFGAGEHQ